MIVDNKAGAAGSIGAVEVKNAKPDGYTLLFAPSSTHAINPTAFVHPAYDAVKDFTPISSICVNPLVLVTHPSMPDYGDGPGRADEEEPGKYSYGSSGTGSILHLAAEYFKREVGGMDVVHVPYKGSKPALQDMMSRASRLDVRDLQHDAAAAPRRQGPHPGLRLFQARRDRARRSRP